MLYGMGTVFIFLTLLVIVTTLMSTLVRRWLPEEDATSPPAASSSSDVDGRVLAIIQAAIDKHRSRIK
jgi:oxaloacetate decarboxylase gamma subunit